MSQLGQLHNWVSLTIILMCSTIWTLYRYSRDIICLREGYSHRPIHNKRSQLYKFRIACQEFLRRWSGGDRFTLGLWYSPILPLCLLIRTNRHLAKWSNSHAGITNPVPVVNALGGNRCWVQDLPLSWQFTKSSSPWFYLIGCAWLHQTHLAGTT